MKNKFGLLGERLGHSSSPQIHGLLGDYEYKLYEKKPEELLDFILGGDFDGVNVTIPYKKDVIPYCVRLSDTARRIGSVNVLMRSPEGLLGYNTDYYGFMYMLFKAGIKVRGRKVLVLGNGGAAATVITALADMCAREIVVMSRREMSQKAAGSVVYDNYNNIREHHDAQLIVNTTPVGMYPNNGTAPVDIEGFEKCEAVLDIICNPLRTKLLLQAEKHGIQTVGGLHMLVAQAKLASRIFKGELIDDPEIDDDDEIDKIVNQIMCTTCNIILIGMPGCGKSTIGKRIAQRLDMQLVDTDDEIVRRAGKSISDIFEEQGENAFRKLETEVLRDVTCKSRLVIATGGGIVTRDENKDLIRQNGRVVFIERDIEELAKEGRPLSLSTPAELLYNQRISNYRGWSDFTVEADSAAQVADRIIKHMYY